MNKKFEGEFARIMADENYSQDEKVAALQANLSKMNIGHGNNLDSMLECIEEYGVTVPTGYPEIDMLLKGGFRTGLNIFAAPPGSGKSTLALQFAERFSSWGTQTVYFCNDMSEEEMVCKAISRHSYLIAGEQGFEAEQVVGLKNNLRQSDVFKRACVSFKENAEKLTFVGDDYSTHLNDIKRLIEHYGTYGTGSDQTVIIIDYLQNIAVDGVNGDKERLDVLVRELKALAKKHRLVIIAISSVNRNSYGRELSMTSLKESGGIEFCADLVLVLQFERVGDDDFDWKKESSKTIRDMELVVLKQRMGRIGEPLPIKYYPKFDLIPFMDKRPSFSKAQSKK
ncbi:DnaB-like helicase C-terminal domain-containing protein [Paenibacillus sp. YN15]|uniref:DnaB-like helicase C-terminal domain-containing protein n=1 Tax=Paenibacillus sp. YN15 TaxID=1742774 RepID=UPI000DCE585E|nr:DnaB-like helicase C-terminal domain-containing protein [Paenibacillus sp. YN15]RAV06615.1 hypothetical protein DQG13_01955 [Paenibacillus sp. YN15]